MTRENIFMVLLSVAAVLFAIVIFLTATGCAGALDPYEPGPPRVRDAGGADLCQAACDSLARLKCDGWDGSPGKDEVFGTKDDVSCTFVCVDIMDESTANLYTACTAQAESCDEIDDCFDESLGYN